MVHSQIANAAEAALCHVRSSVRYRGLNTPGGWIRHPLEMPEKFVARIVSISVGNAMDDQYKGKFNGEYYINQLDKLAKVSQTGNCSELSAVAFNYLRMTGVRPLDYFGVFRGSWNHAFVVMNRDASIPISDFTKWSYDAVVCDPLYDRERDAGFLAAWYPRMLPLQDADVMFRLE